MTAISNAINKVARPDDPWTNPPFCVNCGHALSLAPTPGKIKAHWVHTHNGAIHCGWRAK